MTDPIHDNETPSLFHCDLYSNVETEGTVLFKVEGSFIDNGKIVK